MNLSLYEGEVHRRVSASPVAQFDVLHSIIYSRAALIIYLFLTWNISDSEITSNPNFL
jgi:hypothetical protein